MHAIGPITAAVPITMAPENIEVEKAVAEIQSGVVSRGTVRIVKGAAFSVRCVDTNLAT